MRSLLGFLLLAVAAPVCAEPAALPTQEGDYVVRDFRFSSGATLPELRLHYTTLGRPVRDAAGHVTNAVLVLHGTGGDGHQFLRPQFAGELFGPGQPLDVAKYYVILPDGIGHGKSSKPSDGLHARFPEYGYADMVAAQHLLLTQGLGVDRLRLLMGTSMGCMHAFVWGETYPDFMDAMVPLACLPVQIAGRNRMWRRMVIDAIRDDPAWAGGEYHSEPREALRTASDLLVIAGSAPLYFQSAYPTREAADQRVAESTRASLATLDANDLLYQVGASHDYDPAARLGDIRAPVLWINSADDFINPPELGIAEAQVKRLAHGRFVLLPVSERTRGHGSHTWAALWKSELTAFLHETERAGR
ncbi:MAG: alpha/beta fold hydrolase [Proteobacteria bacterium]|nr:alpha/beta fold hydrolase [Pseudomonadota bacterium]